MSYGFTGAVEELVREHMASGKYESEDALLARALRVLSEHDATIRDITAGVEDEEAGRFRPLREVDAALRQKHGIPHRA
jgi:predicted transcriptional regulator